MASAIQKNFRVRKSFSKLGHLIGIPNLIDIQKRSYDEFLQADVAPEKRLPIGLQGVFSSVFPIKDQSGGNKLDFKSYILDQPMYDVDECRARDATYARPIRVTLQLDVADRSQESGAALMTTAIRQEVFFGEIPVMTQSGTFIINGTERVIVSQLHRSPGVFFDHDKGKTHSSGKLLYNARIIPYRGSWLDFEFDHKDMLYVRIDKKRKLYATVLLRALGYTAEQLLNEYYNTELIHFEQGKRYEREVNYELLIGQRATREIKHPKTKESLVKKGRKFTKAAIRKLEESGINRLPIEIDELVGKVSARDVIDDSTGEVILQVNEELTEEKLDELRERGVEKVEVLFIDNLNVGPWLRNTLLADKLQGPDEAVMEIYRRLRPGDPPQIEPAQKLFHDYFFNPDKYDLSRVGRLKLNHKFNLDEKIENQVLTPKDIIETVRYLIELRNGRGVIDDIDHLGNRRVRAVGELMENQWRIGLVRMERTLKERLGQQDIDTQRLHELVNHKQVASVMKEYFGSSQLSQFMDQTNPLSEVTHKRRLSALGPGGLTRERAGFEVRDVHPTHYGRICPIETPEGPNIGLIASLSTFARVNEYGFIETPYRRVEEGKVSDEVTFFSALQEEGKLIAQANTELKNNRFVGDHVTCRKGSDVVVAKPEDVNLMDVSPNQLVSVAAGLIPFLEHDDANRALMGSNMQRQAVPLIRTSAPLIGTGLEGIVARDSGVTTVARRDGIVDWVDANRIVVRPSKIDPKDPNSVRPDIYTLVKFQRSNQNTCINQKPIVQVGDKVTAGDVIADGPATETGELALGENITVAFMPWGGYNFEDSILINEKLVKRDVFTSIHIEEFECIARDTKLGPEEITRDIASVSDEALGELDESGIVRMGAEVNPNDILVGKITPKGESQQTPEEKLLRAIFGEKAADVRDTSLRVPPGVTGVVIGARVFARQEKDKDERALAIEEAEKEALNLNKKDEIKVISEAYYSKMKDLLLGKTTASRLTDDKKKELVAKGTKLTADILAEVPQKYWSEFQLDSGDGRIEEQLGQLATKRAEDVHAIEAQYEAKIAKLSNADELPPNVIKLVKVYVAIKRKLSVGDKMAGRHGNKGVVSRILPEEDMPYLADGTPVDIVLNPLGVPSRMNIGQILEVHLGWAAKQLGAQIDAYLQTEWSGDVLREKLKKLFPSEEHKALLDKLKDEDVGRFAGKLRRGVHFSTPVFDGAHEDEIKTALKMAGQAQSGQSYLIDGRTGETFENPVTVGVMYMLKLHHLVDDKIHARSTGPYALVTQQPLGGKAQFGGQRLGEMEVWAMEAYGAAYALQEFLTVKSDDVQGRNRMYESIVKGEHILEPGLPESFNVLLRELQALCLDVELVEDPSQPRRFDSGPQAPAGVLATAREMADKMGNAS